MKFGDRLEAGSSLIIFCMVGILGRVGPLIMLLGVITSSTFSQSFQLVLRDNVVLGMEMGLVMCKASLKPVLSLCYHDFLRLLCL